VLQNAPARLLSFTLATELSREYGMDCVCWVYGQRGTFKGRGAGEFSPQ